MSSLTEHAEHEMNLAGLYDDDTDYGAGAIAENVMKLVQTFSDQGHSGGSAAMTIAILDKLIRFEPLTPLTSNPEEWRNVSEMVDKSLWQNKRNPSVFSEDGGQTWYNIEGDEGD